MKLNLGAGRVIFPANHENPPAHLMPLHESAFEPGWLNVDKMAGRGIAEVVDLFAFPWVRSSNGNPWNDDSVDEIYASHLVEHIPHQVKLSAGAYATGYDYRGMVNDLDGWFVFFFECWRLLKPGGVMTVLSPWGLSVGGMTDPSHTRLVLPGAFQYLGAPNADAPFDYGVPCRFEWDDPIIRVDEWWAEQTKDSTPEQITRLALTYFNVVNEFRLTLRAVKNG